MSGSRRSSITIYDYPEHLNPFKDDNTNVQLRGNGESKSSGKEGKNKFWTFGRSRKKRSHSFSIKSTWNGIFGKRKDTPESAERRTTITTVSSTYQKPAFNERRPVAPPRISRDQQEFDEALGTLTRRRKYTFDESSRYGSNLTVNGDPARIYDGSPQDTTASIMGDLTPKPPARRFGQVSPRPKEKIPPLNYDDKDPKGNENSEDDRVPDQTPVPPKRFGQRLSQRSIVSNHEPEEESFLRNEKSSDLSLRDENENVPEDYAFRRCSRDAVRRSNLSINSCVSIGSTASAFGRKKRRAPQPPRPRDEVEIAKDKEVPLSVGSNDTAKVDLRISEPIEISRVTENIEEMTKKSQVIDETSESLPESEKQSDVTVMVSPAEDTEEELKEESSDKSTNEDSANPERKEIPADEIEIRRDVEEKLDILKNVESTSDDDDDDVCLRKKGSSGTLSRSDSFSVKEEIEKIEKQIKALEAKNERRGSENDEIAAARLSIQVNRRSFFKNMVDDSHNGVKIEFKELPRAQQDISIVRLTEPPVPVDAPREPVKVVELHISEPIRQKPEIVGEGDVNPLPKPQRRHSALDNLNNEQSKAINDSRRSVETEKMTSGQRGNSL